MLMLYFKYWIISCFRYVYLHLLYGSENRYFINKYNAGINVQGVIVFLHKMS